MFVKMFIDLLLFAFCIFFVTIWTYVRLCLIFTEAMTTRIFYDYAHQGIANVFLRSLIQMMPNEITRFFLRAILPYCIFLDDWTIIRDVVMTSKHVGNRDAAEILVSVGVPLRFVVDWAKPEMVAMMLAKGAKLNDPDHDSVKTALHQVVEKGDRRLEMARILLKYGANVDAVDQHGYTPLQRTLRLRRPILKIVELLLSRGAKVDRVADDRYRTPLLTAVSFNQPLSVVKVLVEYGAKPLEERDMDDETVMHRACEHERRDLIDYFINLGMNVNVKSKSGWNLISREVFQDCGFQFFNFLMSRNAVLQPIVFQWLVINKANIRDAQEKLRVIWFYSVMDVDGSFYSVDVTMTLFYDVHGHEYSVWMPPMVEIIVLHEFLSDIVDITNEAFLMQQNTRYPLECKEELQRMNSEKLHGGVTLIHLLADKMTKVCQYMRNVKMVRALVKTNFKKNYPIYSPYLEYIIQHVREQYRLKNETSVRLAQLLGFNPDHVVVRKIVNYLEPRDMRVFLSCFANRRQWIEQRRK